MSSEKLKSLFSRLQPTSKTNDDLSSELELLQKDHVTLQRKTELKLQIKTEKQAIRKLEFDSSLVGKLTNTAVKGLTHPKTKKVLHDMFSSKSNNKDKGVK